MLDWLNDAAGPGYVAAILWTIAALVVLVIVLIVVKLVRNLTFGTFVAGGRNRKTRLAVMDATAVDSHRRLVLVRRDDIEHLLLIGGPTDVVVERDIRLVAARKPVLTGDGGQAPQRHAPAPRPHTASPQIRQAAAPAQRAPRPEPAPVATPAAPKYPAVVASAPGARAADATQAVPYSPLQHDPIDVALMNELEVSLDTISPVTASAKEPTLDDEMTKLLGELSHRKG